MDRSTRTTATRHQEARQTQLQEHLYRFHPHTPTKLLTSTTQKGNQTLQEETLQTTTNDDHDEVVAGVAEAAVVVAEAVDQDLQDHHATQEPWQEAMLIGIVSTLVAL